MKQPCRIRLLLSLLILVLLGTVLPSVRGGSCGPDPVPSTPDDCAGVPGGTAVTDCNGQCCGGNTTIVCATLNNCCFCIPAGGNQFEGEDCAGVCFGTAIYDSCGYCCNGTTGVTCDAELDVCGICNGTNSTCLDCNGVPNGPDAPDCSGVCNGTAYINVCGLCVGGNTSNPADDGEDCSGVCFGGAIIDDCGNCTGGSTGIPINVAKDICGICYGNNSDCYDCAGVLNGHEQYDACGVCGGNNQTCLDCNNDPNGGAVIDSCGVCCNGTTGKTCNDERDVCGVCFGFNTTCQDCAGVPNGNATTNACGYCCAGNTTVSCNKGKDSCGVCFGDNSTCTDCNGVVNGTAHRDICGVCCAGNTGRVCNATLDVCGVCNGTNGAAGGKRWEEDFLFPRSGGLIYCNNPVVTNHSCSCADCAGVPNGNAVCDDCGVCCNGTTGTVCNSEKDACGVCFGNNDTCADCFGVPNGPARPDAVGVCNGTTLRAPCGEICAILSVSVTTGILALGGCIALIFCAYQALLASHDPGVRVAPPLRPRILTAPDAGVLKTQMQAPPLPPLFSGSSAETATGNEIPTLGIYTTIPLPDTDVPANVAGRTNIVALLPTPIISINNPNNGHFPIPKTE